MLQSHDMLLKALFCFVLCSRNIHFADRKSLGYKGINNCSALDEAVLAGSVRCGMSGVNGGQLVLPKGCG